jgi:AcrR family transcriptional regulator
MNQSQQNLLKSAYHSFRIHGYHGSSLSEILSAAQIGKSQMYHYYNSKEDLLLATLDFYSSKVYQETYRFMSKIESLEEFEALIDGSTRLCKSQKMIAGCFLGSIAGELAAHNEKVRLHLVSLYQNWKELFVEGLDNLKNKSLLSKDTDTDELAEYFLVSVQGAFVLAKATKDTSVIERSIQKSINYIRAYAI